MRVWGTNSLYSCQNGGGLKTKTKQTKTPHQKPDNQNQITKPQIFLAMPKDENTVAQRNTQTLWEEQGDARQFILH